MKLNGLIVIELVIFANFWLLAFGGEISEFDTIVFFEPEFVFVLIVMSILTGMLIGGLYERWYQEKQNRNKPADMRG